MPEPHEYKRLLDVNRKLLAACKAMLHDSFPVGEDHLHAYCPLCYSSPGEHKANCSVLLIKAAIDNAEKQEIPNAAES